MSWVEVKHALNSTLGTDEFEPLDRLLSHGAVIIKESTVWTVPEGVKYVYITACAGGQSGAVYNTSGSHSYSVNGGDGGDWIYRRPFQVIPGTEHTITIGKGGSGTVSNNGVTQINGENTVISGLITLMGGGVSGNTSGGRAFRVSEKTNINDDSTVLSIAHLLKWAGLTAQSGLLSGGRHCFDTFSSYSIAIVSGGGGSLGYGSDGEWYYVRDENIRKTAGYGGGGGGMMISSSSSSSPTAKAGGDGIVIIEW